MSDKGLIMIGWAALDVVYGYQDCDNSLTHTLSQIKKISSFEKSEVQESTAMKQDIQLNFEKCQGLIPVIAQDAETGQVLMLAYMNEIAWQKTIETGKVHYWSRSRNKLWLKGETSGHVQEVREILVDCDLDTVVIKVKQLGGAACHKGYRSCFYRKVQDGELQICDELIFDPKEIYGK